MAKKMYVGVNNLPKEVKKFYVGVNGVPKKVLKGYVGDISGVPRLFWGGEVPPVPTTGYIIYYDKQFPTSPSGTDITNLYIDSQWHTKTAGGTDITIDHLNQYFFTNKILVMQDNKVQFPRENYPYYFILDSQAQVDYWNNTQSTYPIDPFYLDQGFIFWEIEDSFEQIGSQLIFFIPVKRIYKPKKIKTTYLNTAFYQDYAFGNAGGACIDPNNPNALIYYPSTQQPDEFPYYSDGTSTSEIIDISHHLCDSNIEYLDYIYIWTKSQPKHIIKMEVDSEIDRNNITVKSTTITPSMVKDAIANFIANLTTPMNANLRNSLNTNIDAIANYLAKDRSEYTFSGISIVYNNSSNIIIFALEGWTKNSTYIETGYQTAMSGMNSAKTAEFFANTSPPPSSLNIRCRLSTSGMEKWGIQQHTIESRRSMNYTGYIFEKTYSYVYTYDKTFYDIT